MPNIRKSFNFREGIQVDDDNFIVNSNGLVGIGTSVPSELLHVIGTVKVVGVVTATEILSENANITGVVTASSVVVGVTSISHGIITATSPAGIVTYYGDGGRLLNLPTSQWQDVDVGLGFTSIYNAGYVGISTNDPRFNLQIGGNANNFESGVGISSYGDIHATGLVIAGNFSGDGSDITNLDAGNISQGYLNEDRIPESFNVTGIITASEIYANLTGYASTANSFNPAITLIAPTVSIGVATVTDDLYVADTLGIGTYSSQSALHVRRTGIATVQITSDTQEAVLALGRSTDINSNNGQIRFGNRNTLYPYSGSTTLDVVNLNNGGLNYYINGTSNFNWISGNSSVRATLTSSGLFGIGTTTPTNTCHVSGTSTVTSNAWFGSDVEISGETRLFDFFYGTSGYFESKLGIGTDSISSTYDLQVGSDPDLSSGVGITSTGIIKATNSIISSKSITALENASVTGILTATSFVGDGSNLTNLNANNLTSGSINNAILPTDANISGILTANTINATSYGDISASSITASSSVSSASTITASEGFSTGSGNLLALGTGRIEITISGSDIVFTDSNSGQSASLPLS